MLTVAELGVVDYDDALAMQTAMLAARIEGRIGDTLLMLEHPHVFTLGRGADERFIVANTEGVPIRRVSRGGEVTYHGPGQLIGYPILKLEGRDRDVTKYLRNLEAAMIDALAKFGIEAGRRDRMTGVWVGARKIASIGVGIKRWAVKTMAPAAGAEAAMGAAPTAFPQELQNCAPEVIGVPHLSQNMDSSSFYLNTPTAPGRFRRTRRVGRPANASSPQIP